MRGRNRTGRSRLWLKRPDPILLIDDEGTLRLVVAKMLRRKGFLVMETVTAGPGRPFSSQLARDQRGALGFDVGGFPIIEIAALRFFFFKTLWRQREDLLFACR